MLWRPTVMLQRFDARKNSVDPSFFSTLILQNLWREKKSAIKFWSFLRWAVRRGDLEQLHQLRRLTCDELYNFQCTRKFKNFHCCDQALWRRGGKRGWERWKEARGEGGYARQREREREKESNYEVDEREWRNIQGLKVRKWLRCWWRVRKVLWVGVAFRRAMSKASSEPVKMWISKITEVFVLLYKNEIESVQSEFSFNENLIGLHSDLQGKEPNPRLKTFFRVSAKSSNLFDLKKPVLGFLLIN